MSATAAASLTSARQAIALPPKPSISLTTLSMASCLRWPLTTTFAPARAKCSAIDLPIFWPEPVTMAVRPASGLAGSTFFSVVTDIVASSITLPAGAPSGSVIEEATMSVTTEKNVDPAKPLAGRTAIVTGSGQNIGKSIALHFARAGANVVVNGHRKQEAIDNVVKEIEGFGGKAMACLADVSDAAAVADMVKKAQDKFGSVDIAVSNVSLRLHQMFYEITLDDWDRICLLYTSPSPRDS